MMFTIRPATAADLDPALAALGEAFADDPLMIYLFGDHPDGVRARVMAFFSILLRVRLELGMPALVLEEGGQVLGAAMGYDVSRPQWSAPLAEEWRSFESSAPDLPARFAAYEEISVAHEPGDEHHYLGVLGVHPVLQGRGAGKALLAAYCEGSRTDDRSHGVYLDTSNPRSLEFYYRNGFELRGEGSLDDASIWCVWLPTRAAGA
jgi:ribosomal protein S18 acetylase RimI-like enzyme